MTEDHSQASQFSLDPDLSLRHVPSNADKNESNSDSQNFKCLKNIFLPVQHKILRNEINILKNKKKSRFREFFPAPSGNAHVR